MRPSNAFLGVPPRGNARLEGPRRRIRAAMACVVACSIVLTSVQAAHAQDPLFTPNPHPHSVVVDWVEVMLEAIELNPPAPTATTWKMWVVASSMYDAWAAYDGRALATQTGYATKRPAAERTPRNKHAAISYAAHRALRYVYPNQSSMFDELLATLGYPASDSVDPTTPAGVGNAAAAAVIAYREQDGSNATGEFTQIVSDTYPELYLPTNSDDPSAGNGPLGPDFDPNHWGPLRVPTGSLLDDNGIPVVDDADPTTYTVQGFLTPHWGAVSPFALTSGDQFRPPAPPLHGSDEPYVDALGNVSTNDEAWHSQLDEIVDLGGKLTDEHRIIAEFWADGPHTWTPPGHWVQLAIGVALRDGHSIDDDIRMYMALTGALLDSGISAWEAKRAYDFVRPVSAIRYHYAGQLIMGWAGPNQGIQLIDGSEWRPYQSPTFVTPPFPEFTSGHSTFSRASAEVLTAFTGSAAMYDGATRLGRDYDGDGSEDLFGRHVAVPGSMMFEDGPAETIVLTWDTFYDAADEAAASRRYGGIHFQDGDLHARFAGEKIGKQAYAHAELYWDPFGKIRSTLQSFAVAREIPRPLANLVGAWVNAAGAAIGNGNEATACRLLARADRVVDRHGGDVITPGAHEVLDRQFATVIGALC